MYLDVEKRSIFQDELRKFKLFKHYVQVVITYQFKFIFSGIEYVLLELEEISEIIDQGELWISAFASVKSNSAETANELGPAVACTGGVIIINLWLLLRLPMGFVRQDWGLPQPPGQLYICDTVTLGINSQSLALGTLILNAE